ncbi:hypothetical protein DIPPA_01951 [Diplonema papillatum]|nr:hypothetical protein DIPPA_01951 [Diplonema papillatum]
MQSWAGSSAGGGTGSGGTKPRILPAALTAENLKKAERRQQFEARHAQPSQRVHQQQLQQHQARGARKQGEAPDSYPTDGIKYMRKPHVYTGKAVKAPLAPSRKRIHEADVWLHRQRQANNELRFLFRDTWS